MKTTECLLRPCSLACILARILSCNLVRNLGLLTGLALALPGLAQAEKWDMPMAYAASNYHSRVGAEFAKCVTDGTSGELEIVTHPGGALFAGADIKRAVQTGQAPIGERLLSGHQNENALFGYDSIPFLATSFDASDKLYAAAKEPIDALLKKQGLTLLYSVPWPPQGLYFKKEVNSVADMKGVKFRSYNNATARLAELTGMLPVTIEAAEVAQAFATGVAESMISSSATGYDQKVWESLTHFYQVDAWLPRNYVFANTDAWNGLTDETRTIALGCAADAQDIGNKRARDYTQFALDGLAESGMIVAPPGDELRTELEAIGATITEEWLELTGDEGKALIDAYQTE